MDSAGGPRGAHFADVDGALLQIVGADVSTPADGPPDAPRTHVRFTLRGRFDEPPRALRVGVSFVTPSDPVVVVGARASWSGAPSQMQLEGPPGVGGGASESIGARVERFVAALMDGKLSW